MKRTQTQTGAFDTTFSNSPGYITRAEKRSKQAEASKQPTRYV